MTGRRALALAALAVAALAVALYARTAGFGFLAWDDDLNVAANPRLDPPSLAALRAFWTAPYQHLYAPLSYTLFWLEAKVTGGPQPWLFHATSVALHAGNAALVVLLFARLGAPVRAAALGAALFAVHPLQAEAVSWISEQRGLLAAALGLAALCVHAGAAPTARRAALSAALVALALLAKPSAAALPLVGLALEAFVLRRGARAALAGLGAWFMLAAGAALLAKSLQADEAVREVVPAWQRPWVALDAVEFYLRKLVWPFGLAPDYGRRPSLVVAGFPDGTTLLAGAALVAAVAVPALRRRALAPLAVFLAALAPVLGLVPFAHQDLSTVADRYAYLALLGPALALALALPARAPRWLLAAVVAVLALLGAQSVRQSGHWRDTESIFTRVLQVNRRSWVAHTNLGLLRQARGDLAGARAELEEAVRVRPEHARAHQDLGVVLVQQGHAAEGEASLRRALELEPGYARPCMNLAAVLADQGRLDEAEEFARRGVLLDPEDAAQRTTLGNVLLRRGAPADASVEFSAALERRPRDVEAWFGLGLCDLVQGRRAAARATLEHALELARARHSPRVRDIEANLQRLAETPR